MVLVGPIRAMKTKSKPISRTRRRRTGLAEKISSVIVPSEKVLKSKTEEKKQDPDVLFRGISLSRPCWTKLRST